MKWQNTLYDIFYATLRKFVFLLSFYTMQFETELCIMTYCKSYINVFLSFEMTIGRNFLLSWTNIYFCTPLKISERIFININPFINNGTNIFYQWSTLVLSRLNCSILPYVWKRNSFLGCWTIKSFWYVINRHINCFLQRNKNATFYF